MHGLAQYSKNHHETRRLQGRSLSPGRWAWVAEIPAIPGCHAFMSTREAALAELTKVFAMIADESVAPI